MSDTTTTQEGVSGGVGAPAEEDARLGRDEGLRERVRAVTQAPSREEQDAHDALVRARQEGREAPQLVKPVGELPVELEREDSPEEQLAREGRVLPQDVGGAPLGAEVVQLRSAEEVLAAGSPVRRTTKVQWERMLESYRKLPRGHKAAAKAAGVNVETAKKAWNEGFRYAEWGRVPIGKLVEQEQRDARAIVQQRYSHEAAQRLHAEVEKERLAQEQAAEARADEGMALQFGRKNTKQLLAATASLLPGLRLLANRVNESLNVHMGEGKVLTLGQAKEALQLVEKAAVTVRHLVAATEGLIEAERMHLGEPGKRVGLVVMSAEQAKEELARAKRAFEFVERGEEDPDIIDVTHHRFKAEGE